MKKTLITGICSLLAISSVVLSGCNVFQKEDQSKDFGVEGFAEDVANHAGESVVFDSMCIDMQVNEDGYYSMYAKTIVHYDDSSIDYIIIDDPVLLSFAVSSQYGGGVWILDLDEGEQIISELGEIEETLESLDIENEEILKKIRDIIHTISYSGPFTQEST